MISAVYCYNLAELGPNQLKLLQLRVAKSSQVRSGYLQNTAQNATYLLRKRQISFFAGHKIAAPLYRALAAAKKTQTVGVGCPTRVPGYAVSISEGPLFALRQVRPPNSLPK